MDGWMDGRKFYKCLSPIKAAAQRGRYESHKNWSARGFEGQPIGFESHSVANSGIVELQVGLIELKEDSGDIKEWKRVFAMR